MAGAAGRRLRLLLALSAAASTNTSNSSVQCHDRLASNFVPAAVGTPQSGAGLAAVVGGPSCSYNCARLAEAFSFGEHGECYDDPAARWLRCSSPKEFETRGGELHLATDSLFLIEPGTNLILHGRRRTPGAAASENFTAVDCRLHVSAGSGLGLRAVTLAGRRSMHSGGAIEAVEAAAVWVEHVQFDTNRAGFYGGAISGDSSSPVALRTSFGAAYPAPGWTTATISRCQFTDNRAGLNGGAVSGAGGQWLVSHSVFEGGRGEGGGLAGDGGLWLVEHSTFVQNSAPLGNWFMKGGAIFAGQADRTPGRPPSGWRVLLCSFDGNYAAAEGGAVYAEAVRLTLVECSFEGNTAIGDGDAVAVHDYHGAGPLFWLNYGADYGPAGLAPGLLAVSSSIGGLLPPAPRCPAMSLPPRFVPGYDPGGRPARWGGQATRTICPPGHSCQQANHTFRCSRCPAGRCSADGLECRRCSPGTSSGAGQADKCRACPIGRFSADADANSSPDPAAICERCEPGVSGSLDRPAVAQPGPGHGDALAGADSCEPCDESLCAAEHRDTGVLSCQPCTVWLGPILVLLFGLAGGTYLANSCYRNRVVPEVEDPPPPKHVFDFGAAGEAAEVLRKAVTCIQSRFRYWAAWQQATAQLGRDLPPFAKELGLTTEMWGLVYSGYVEQLLADGAAVRIGENGAKLADSQAGWAVTFERALPATAEGVALGEQLAEYLQLRAEVESVFNESISRVKDLDAPGSPWAGGYVPGAVRVEPVGSPGRWKLGSAAQSPLRKEVFCTPPRRRQLPPLSSSRSAMAKYAVPV